MAKTYVCPGCESRVTDDRLVYPVPDVQEKVLPGEPMPYGECPECGSLIREENLIRAERGIEDYELGGES